MSHVPRKRFGQNFLVDQHAIAAIIAAINPHPADIIIEIGPGGGALTQGLVASHAHVHAVEIDRDLVEYLATEYADCPNFTLHCLDVLKFPLHTVLAPDAKNKLRIVGNLPYNISTPLLFKLFDQIAIIQDMHFMLQREVALRLTAQPNTKDYGRMSVMAQYYCAMETVLDVAPHAFNPPPKVHSCVVKFTPHAKQVMVEDHSLLQEIVTHAFNQRRKTIANSLKIFLTADELTALEIAPQLRAENLSLIEYAKITNYLAKD